MKQRISSRHGHLSNKAAAELIKKLHHPELVQIALGHLSADCNRTELALKAVAEVIEKNSPTKYWCAGPDTISPTITF